MNRILTLAWKITKVPSSSESLWLFSIFWQLWKKSLKWAPEKLFTNPGGRLGMVAADRLPNTQVVQRFTLIFLKPEKEGCQVSRLGSSSPPSGLPAHRTWNKALWWVAGIQDRGAGLLVLAMDSQPWAKTTKPHGSTGDHSSLCPHLFTPPKREDFTCMCMKQRGLWGWPWISWPHPVTESACF